MTSKRKLQILVLCLVASIAGGVTFAAFSSQTSSSGNTFSAAASFGGTLRMASGTFEGNGTAGRQITGLGFAPDVVIVKNGTGDEAFMRTGTMPAGLSKRLVGANSAETNHITSLDADGFTVGSNIRVNENTSPIYWMAFKAGNGTLKIGSYTGNGTSQSISGLGFSPEYVILADDNNARAVQRFAGSSNSYRFDADSGLSTRVTTLNADGFSVGNAAEANQSGRTYHYVAFNEAAGSVKVGNYTGTGATRSVSGVGFAPEYVIVRAAGNLTGQHRSATVPGAQSMYFQNNANITTAITAMQADGFQTGSHSSVNTSGTPYQYVAFGNSAGGCAQPSTGQLLLGANDSWVDQSAPSNNNGSDSVLKVTSKSTNLNTRAFIDFDLPSRPTGCVVTAATLYMYVTSPVSGRTLEARQVAGSWTEGGITWSNQPATTGTPATATIPGAAGWVGWTVTSLVESQYSAGNFGFRLSDQTENFSGGAEQQFGSRESGTTPPVLSLSLGG